MACDRKPAKAEMSHESDAVPGFGTLGGSSMVHGVRRYRGPAKAPQIGADNCVVGGEKWGYPVPGNVRPRMAMQQKKRRA
ncbi:hypothetical protein X773_03250 [Mesorhizobium sp. LSJC285A00]|nr:hypothetical protein X773_03250 [Mesorhizobium sp. LSJC285A00]